MLVPQKCWCAKMCDPSSEKNGDIAEDGVSWIEGVNIRMEEIANMVKHHDDHYESL